MTSPTIQRFTVERRTFQAAKFPPGSSERARLNESSVTSEYMPSYRYEVVDRDHPRAGPGFRTKRQAEDFLASKTGESQ